MIDKWKKTLEPFLLLFHDLILEKLNAYSLYFPFLKNHTGLSSKFKKKDQNRVIIQ